MECLGYVSRTQTGVHNSDGEGRNTISNGNIDSALHKSSLSSHRRKDTDPTSELELVVLKRFASHIDASTLMLRCLERMMALDPADGGSGFSFPSLPVKTDEEEGNTRRVRWWAKYILKCCKGQKNTFLGLKWRFVGNADLDKEKGGREETVGPKTKLSRSASRPTRLLAPIALSSVPKSGSGSGREDGLVASSALVNVDTRALQAVTFLRDAHKLGGKSSYSNRMKCKIQVRHVIGFVHLSVPLY